MSEKLISAFKKLYRSTETDLNANILNFVEVLGPLQRDKFEVQFKWREDSHANIFRSHDEALNHVTHIDEGIASIEGTLSYSPGYGLIAVHLTDDEEGPIALLTPWEIKNLNSVK